MNYSVNLLKKIILLSPVSILFTGCRNSTRRAYEIFGLPDKGEIIPSLKLGIPIIATGILLIFLANKWSTKEKTEGSTFSNVLVALGVITIIAGVIVIFPAIMWLEAIFASILSFLMAILIVILVIVAIWLLIRKMSSH